MAGSSRRSGEKQLLLLLRVTYMC